jgi:hypothetical protein
LTQPLIRRPADPLRFPSLDPSEVRRFRRGPWCWPWPEQADRLERARRLVGADEPSLVPGQVLLLTVSEANGAALWSFPAVAGEPPSETRGFTEVTARVWKDACSALPRSLPFLWESLSRARDVPLLAAEVGRVPREGRTGALDPVLAGDSFGLSLVLSLASRALDEPIPEDVAASARIDAFGLTHPVGEIADKVAALLCLGPRVRRLLVAVENAAEAQDVADALGGALRVTPVRSVLEALRHCLGSRLELALVEAGRSPEERTELVDSLYRLAVGGRHQVLDWTPVHRAAGHALERWGDSLSADERTRLELARAIAARHENNQGALPLPDPHWLTSLPLLSRLDVVTQLVEQAADTGTPSAEETEVLALPLLPPREERLESHLRLAGALARLWAVTGRARQALALQEATARAWIDSGRVAPSSFPLAEAFRLAAALADRQALGRAEGLRRMVEKHGGLDESGATFVRLARCRALLSLKAEGPDERAWVQRMAESEHIPSHARWSAIRWLIWLIDHERLEGDASASLDALAARAQSDANDAIAARKYLALVHLDRAIRLGDAVGADDAVTRLAQLEPGLVRQILRDIPPQDRGAHLSRFYPY